MSDAIAYDLLIRHRVHLSEHGTKMWAREPGRGDYESVAIVVLDPTADEAAVSEQQNGQVPPTFIKIRCLSEKGSKVMMLTHNSMGVTVSGGMFMEADVVITEERNSDVKFVPNNKLNPMTIFDMSTGADHSMVCVAKQSHIYVAGRGDNSMGQLGMGDVKFVTRYERIEIPGNPRIVQVKCGSFFTMLLSATGEVYVFGDNSKGQHGQRRRGDVARTPMVCRTLRSVPISEVATGSNHALALSFTGVVFGSGSNEQGQLGMEPGQTPLLMAFTVLPTLENVYMVRIAAYGSASAAIDEFGSLYFWGGKIGYQPKVITLPNRRSFVDVVLGADGRAAALASRGELFIFGYTIDGIAARLPMKCYSPELPFRRIFSGGEYFVVLADRVKGLPLKSPEYGVRMSLLKPIPFTVPNRLRPVRRIMALSRDHMSVVMRSSDAQMIMQMIFSSSSCLNASFVSDKFSESQIDAKSGLDIDAVVYTYQIIGRSKNVQFAVTSALGDLLSRLNRDPSSCKKPLSMRFILIAMLHPSPRDLPRALDLWTKIPMIVEAFGAHQIIAQWLSVLETERLRGIMISLKDLLKLTLRDAKIAYSKRAVDIVKTLECVWFAATRSGQLSFDEFYHTGVNKILVIKEECKRWRHHHKHKFIYARNAPWLLDADAKTRFLRAHAGKMMKKQQSRLLRRMSNPTEACVEDLWLILEIDRADILRDTFRAISTLPEPEMDLKKPLKIRFKGEPGIDQGGVQREFFELIVKELVDPTHKLFVIKNNFYWFNIEATNESSLMGYELLGTVCGMAIYNGDLLNVKFPLSVYKKLRRFAVSLPDLVELDPDVYQSMNAILTYTGDLENDMYLYFEYGGAELCPGGAERAVTKGNREEFVDLVTKYILVESVRKQFDAFRNGFLRSAGDIVLDLFRPEEIALLVAGREHLDFSALQKATRYEGYSPQSRTVRNFWKIVHHKLRREERKKLLYFITASPRAPINGLGSLHLVIKRDPNPTHIPTSHTCFFQLVLPDDSNEKRLHQKLKIAIDNCEGFALK